MFPLKNVSFIKMSCSSHSTVTLSVANTICSTFFSNNERKGDQLLHLTTELIFLKHQSVTCRVN